MFAIFAPPLPITLPTAFAGITMSKVDGVGNLQQSIAENKQVVKKL